MPRPLIGITTRPPDSENRYAQSRLYVDAVRRAGGIPVLLPLGEDPQAVYARLDGLILSGGGDIDPALYGGKDHPMIYAVSRERDEFEIALARTAAAGSKPCMPICRGMQVTNVALGGTLMEHLEDEVGTAVIHRDHEQKVGMNHPVDILPGTRLAAICGPVCETVSWHHQAVRKTAPGLVIAARASDGIIEALEKPDHPWFVALQWHPEMSAAEDPVQQALFNEFVQASARGMEKK